MSSNINSVYTVSSNNRRRVDTRDVRCWDPVAKVNCCQIGTDQVDRTIFPGWKCPTEQENERGKV